jgi:hypothetical protein
VPKLHDRSGRALHVPIVEVLLIELALNQISNEL